MMGWFDDIFGGSQAPAQNTPAAPAQAVPANYGDFLQNYARAAALNEKANPTNLLSWLTGSGRDAATAAAGVNAPGAYLALQQAQQQNRSGNLDMGQTAAALQRMGYDPVRMMNGDFGSGQGQPQSGQPPQAPGQFSQPQIPAAPVMAGTSSAPAGGPSPAPQGQPAPGLFPRLAAAAGQGMPGMSGMGAPQSQGQAPQSGNPVQAQLGNYAAMARAFSGLPKFAAQALEYSKLGQTGVPDGGIRGLDGAVYDGANFAPLTGSSQDIAARRAGAISGAQANAAVGAHNAEETHKGVVQIGVHGANADTDAAHALTTYVDNGLTKQGTVAQALAAAHNGTGGFTTGFADPDTHKAQVAEVVGAQEKGDAADKTIGTLSQLSQALKQFPQHGKLGPMFLKAAQGIDGIGLASPTLQGQIASGELANQGSASVVAAMTKDVSARGPVAIFRYIDGIKPSIKSAEPWLAIQALQQDAQRQKDLAEFTPQYYGSPANATKLDAQSAFNKTHPIEMYASRVLPVSLPARGTPPQVGFTYNLPNHGPATWDGQQFQPVSQ